MPDIGNIQGLGGAGGVLPVGGPRPHAGLRSQAPVEQDDVVEISKVAEMLGKIRDLPDIRAEKVSAIREAIELGTYDEQGKLDVAIDRLLEDLGYA